MPVACDIQANTSLIAVWHVTDMDRILHGCCQSVKEHVRCLIWRGGSGILRGERLGCGRNDVETIS